MLKYKVAESLWLLVVVKSKPVVLFRLPPGQQYLRVDLSHFVLQIQRRVEEVAR
jgi:hypothetical protein